jgi:energy-coupling factor transporter ATP-binding protein EcfA2
MLDYYAHCYLAQRIGHHGITFEQYLTDPARYDALALQPEPLLPAQQAVAQRLAGAPGALRLENGRVLVLVGPQGSGKTRLARALAGREGPYREIDSLEIESPFQSWMDADIKTVIVDGVARSHRAMHNLKTWISNPRMTVHRKYKEPESMPTPHFIFCTNASDLPVYLHDDRRLRIVHLNAAFGGATAAEHPMTTLAEALPAQQARCREILERAVAIGPSGAFLAAMLRQSLTRAERAAAAGDLPAMIRALNDLQAYSE